MPQTLEDLHNEYEGFQNHTPKTETAPPFQTNRLRELPIKRDLPWREGREVPKEQSSESPRYQQRGAAYLASRGDVARTPCAQCANGNGRFSECIILSQWFQGACASCLFVSKGNKCSLRVDKIGDSDARALRHVADSDTDLAPFHEKARSPVKKRKKRSDLGSPKPSSLPISYQHEDDTITVKDEQTSPKSQRLQKKLKINHGPPARSPSTTHSTCKASEPSKVLADPEDLDINSLYNAVAERSHHKNKSLFDVVTATPTLGYANPPYNDIQNRAPTDGRSHEHSVNSVPTPLIDTLPKAKQRQIYGLMSGLQGGIDSLQKQLNSLQAAFGIDLEDPTS